MFLIALFLSLPNNEVMSDFKERLLKIMDQKDHWGWKQVSGPHVNKKQLLVHFQQEFDVFVRDFPIFLARVLGRIDRGDFRDLKRELAENIYEEQTGGLSAKISHNLSHPDLFLKMMRGLGYKDKDFKNIALLPTSLAYRSYLDLITLTKDWRIGAAALTLWVEGSREDRARLKKDYKPVGNLSEKIKSHSLYKFHGLKEKDMDLVKAHHAIEGSHRKSAWETVLRCIPKTMEDEIIETMSNCLELWMLYRDGICLEMGLDNPEFNVIIEARA
jgi:pyrroloquinoline quinone (PQQ) biosynthesis protein C